MSEILVDKLTGKTTADSVTVTDGATTFNMLTALNKMWISFDGINLVTFASFNVSSVTDNGSGDYTYNFSNNFNATEEYSCAMSACLQSSAYMGSYTEHNTHLTSSITVNPARNSSGTNLDLNNTTMNCCGELA